MSNIVIIGPAHPLRGGGLTTFNHRLAKAFTDSGDDCVIYSFSLQYPSFLFPGTSQYTDEPAPMGLKIISAINSINPLNWIRVGNRLRKEKPDLIIVRFWLPFMGPALGTILRRVRKNKVTKIICIADNVRPHEVRAGDKMFTRYFLKACHAFIVMSEKVMQDLRYYEKIKPAKLIPHPIYDTFGASISKTEARKKLDIADEEKVILFFGFIRKYKGLDILLHAMADERIRRAGIKLLIAGEFYGDEKWYAELINTLGVKDQLYLQTHFISDSEVPVYFCAADVVIQPYRNATQSGVTPLAYHFEKPMIVTNVGGLPDMVPHEKVGLVTTPEPIALAESILWFYQFGEDYFIPHLRSEKVKYSWENFIRQIHELADSIKA
ncbi:MAG TPA: glycosyltransferase [Saprospiraceae bacterium]|nr:glycosyltransferase [Saprospiraceae bacterium]